jgi:hypothetical protein
MEYAAHYGDEVVIGATAVGSGTKGVLRGVLRVEQHDSTRLMVRSVVTRQAIATRQRGRERHGEVALAAAWITHDEGQHAYRNAVGPHPLDGLSLNVRQLDDVEAALRATRANDLVGVADRSRSACVGTVG